MAVENEKLKNKEKGNEIFHLNIVLMCKSDHKSGNKFCEFLLLKLGHATTKIRSCMLC